MTPIRKIYLSCLALSASWGLWQSPVQAQSVSASVAAEFPTARLLSRYGLEQAWWGHATLNPKRDKMKFLVVDEENVYAQSTNGVITAFDADSGKRLWSVQLGYRDEPIFPAVSNNQHLLAVNGMTLYCLARFSGEVVWELKLPAMPSASPATDDQSIYIGTLDGSVYAFDLRKIDQLYRKRLLPQWSYESTRWRYRTSKEISTQPHSSGRLVNFASRDGSLYAVSTTERKLTWQFETNAPISAEVAATETSLILASEDNFVYCLNRENGLVKWEFASGFPIRRAPRVINDDLYVLPDRGGLFNLSIGSGIEKWSRPGVSDFLAASKTRLFMADPTGNVVILQRSDGRILGSLPMRAFNVRFENDRTDRLFLATTTGLIVCLREKGAEFATYHRFPDRSPLVPEIEPDEEPSGDPKEMPDAMPAEPKENAEANQ